MGVGSGGGESAGRGVRGATEDCLHPKRGFEQMEAVPTRIGVAHTC
jgi:hypothetical protein